MKVPMTERADFLTLALMLALVGIVAAVLLGWVSVVTAEAITAAEGRSRNQALAQVLPEGFANAPAEQPVELMASDGSGQKVTFYGALDRDGRLIGVAGETSSANGYAGGVAVLAGLTPAGAVRTVAEGRSGVLVTKHQETPGLGSVVADRKEMKTLATLFTPSEGTPGNPILDQFAGRGANGAAWEIQKDGGEFLYKTGATITSRAVTEAVQRIVTTYAVNQSQLETEFKK